MREERGARTTKRKTAVVPVGDSPAERSRNRIEKAAENILENVLMRRNYPAVTREKLADALEALVASEIKGRMAELRRKMEYGA